MSDKHGSGAIKYVVSCQRTHTSAKQRRQNCAISVMLLKKLNENRGVVKSLFYRISASVYKNYEKLYRRLET